MRFNRSWGLGIAFGISLFWTVSLFVAPATVPSGTVTGLDGSSNAVDYPDLWAKLNPYAGAIYSAGDSQCHQKWYRVFYINGNEMPVCQRTLAIYIGLTLGLFHAFFTRPSYDLFEAFMNGLPRRFRRAVRERIRPSIFVPLFIMLLLVPMGIDGTVQLLTRYESDYIKRLLTGLPTGWMTGFLLGAMITSLGEAKRLTSSWSGVPVQSEEKQRVREE